MEYIKVVVNKAGGEMSGLVVAMLSELGYQGFEEDGEEIFAYIEQPAFELDGLEEILGTLGLPYATEIIPAQNWNAVWESNFEPITLPGFCRIRADFHEPDLEIPLELVIIPKMSFGTGHHATTQLMMLAMKHLDFKEKVVVDFGTGTGVLAILAEKLGAGKVIAIDNDPWSVANALENVERNGCSNIEVREGALEAMGPAKADILLANINRHILLQYMPMMSTLLPVGGELLLSGILAGDREIVVSSALEHDLEETGVLARDNWIALSFRRR